MIELPTEVIGLHGTHRDVVPRLLAHDIQVSDQHFEWLGIGFFLWQESPWRAQEWAVERFGDDAAVIIARVGLDGCLDLLNPYWQRELADADDQDMAECLAEDRPPAQNRPSGNRAWDCAVINWYCDSVAGEGLHIRSVRAIFEEGGSDLRGLGDPGAVPHPDRRAGPLGYLDIEEMSW